MINLNTDISNIKTKEDVDALIAQYYGFISIPLEIIAGREEGAAYDEEEVEQLLRLLMIFHANGGSGITLIVDVFLLDCDGFWMDRSNKSLKSKMRSLKRKYDKELKVCSAIGIAFNRYANTKIRLKSLSDQDYEKIFQHLSYLEKCNWDCDVDDLFLWL